VKSDPWIYPQFISPMSGRINNQGVQSLIPNYTFIGDRNGFVVESPILIDIRIDISQIKKTLGTTPFILQKPIAGFDNSQALNQLTDGILMTTGGILTTTPSGDYVPNYLPTSNIWIGNDDNVPIPNPQIALGNLPNLLTNNIYLGDGSNRPQAVSTFNGNFGLNSNQIWRGNISNLAVPVNDLTTLESTVSNQGNSILDLLSGLSSLVSIVNGLSSSVGIIEAGLALLGGFPVLLGLIANVAALDAASLATNFKLNNLTLNGIANSTSTSGDVNLNTHKLINVADATNPNDAVNIRVLNGLLMTLTGPVSGSGTTVSGIPTTFNLKLNQIPLAIDYVDLNGQRIVNLPDPIDLLDAVNLETLISYIDAIPGEVTITLGGAVSGSGLSTSTIMTTLNTTLDAVPVAIGNVDINNNKLTNVADPTDFLDAVNLETLISYIDAIPEASITLIGSVSGSGLLSSSISTTLNTTLDAVPLAVADVNINNNKIINVSDPTNPLDVVNLEYLESYVTDNVTPILYVDGATQTIYYDSAYKTNTLNILNNSTPAIGNSSHNNLVLTTLYGALTLEWSSFVYSSLFTAPVFSMYYDSDIADITQHQFFSAIANHSDLGSEIEIDLTGRTIIDTQGSYFSILHNGDTVFDIEQDGDVNCNDNAIIDLKTLSFSNWSDMEAKAQYAINYLFLWEFLGGGVS
jgi:hypothetical protein